MRRHNPLSDKRRFFLEQAYASRFDLDEESVKDVDETEIEARKAQLSQFLDWLSEADPTPSGKYAVWVARLHKRNLVQFPEDISKINESLQEFERAKHTLPTNKRDINSYRSYGELARTLDEHTGVGVREAERIATEEGQEVILEESGYRVIKVTTQEAATKLARKTKWCVKDPEWGINYIEWGPLYFIDKLKSDGTSSRFALAWKGSCEKRKEQFEKFKQFVEETAQKKICPICLKTRCRGHNNDFAFNNINYQDFNYHIRYRDFEEGLSEHLRPFLSHSDCQEFYSVLNTYDDPLDDKELQSITPILLKLFFSDPASMSRESLQDFYGVVLADNEKNIQVEQELFKTGDPNKLLDYYATLRIEHKRRWKQIEPLVFKDPLTAARYYEMIQKHLTDEDLKELATLGQTLPSVEKPVAPALPQEVPEKTFLFNDYRRKKDRTEDRIKQMRRRMRREKKRLDDRVTKRIQKKNKEYQDLVQSINKAIEQADQGVSVERILPSLQKKGSDYYRNDILEEDPEHPFNQFLVDFIGHYNKGFIEGNVFGRRIRRRKGDTRPRRTVVGRQLYSADRFVSDPYLFREPRIRRGRPHLRKSSRAQKELVAYANRTVRRNPLPFRYVTGHGRPHALRMATHRYKRAALGSIRKVQSKIWEFMRDNGLQWSKGFTFMDQDAYVRARLKDLKHPSKVDIARYALNAPGFILCSATKYDDLYAVLTSTTNSHFFETLREKYFADDPLADRKLQAISSKLNRSLENMLQKFGWKAYSLDDPLYVRSKKYKHHDYQVFAIYPLKRGRRSGLNSLVPYYWD